MLDGDCPRGLLGQTKCQGKRRCRMLGSVIPGWPVHHMPKGGGCPGLGRSLDVFGLPVAFLPLKFQKAIMPSQALEAGRHLQGNPEPSSQAMSSKEPVGPPLPCAARRSRISAHQAGACGSNPPTKTLSSAIGVKLIDHHLKVLPEANQLEISP